MATQLSPASTTVGLGRREDRARARARTTLTRGLALSCLAAVSAYLQAAYLHPYLTIRRQCARALR